MSHSELEIALSEFQQVLLPDQTAQLASLSSHVPTADDIVRLTGQITQINASRRSRLFASRLEGLLGSVQQYCTIIDTWAGSNQMAALIWGSIKLFLLVSSNFAEYFDKLSKRIAQLSNFCPRFAQYEKLFSTSPRLQQALSDFYAIVVKFCTKALRFVQENGIKQFSKSIWKSFKSEFKEIEESISEAKDEVTEELQLASEQAKQRFRCLLTAEIEENRDFRSQQTLTLQRTQARQIQKILKEEERQKIRLLRLIPSYNYANSLHRARARRLEGTCSWILNKFEFQSWINQTGLKHLWCYGIPGCGKTVLMGYIIDHLIKVFPARNETCVIYYFFDSSNKKSLKISTFLRCILHQAIRLESLPPDSQRRLESLFIGQIDQLEPDARELEQLFLNFYRKFKTAFLLIDGLDEADKVEQRNIIYFLKEVQKMDGARIFAITHAAMDMSKVFTRSYALHIKPEDLRDDIEMFVQSQIDKYSQDELLNCSPSILDIIKRKLVSDAEGMFLWVDLQFKTILDAYEEDGTPERFPDLLETLPRGITDLYTLLLEKLSRGAVDRAEKAKKAFQWVVYSERPLTIGELEEAISITTDQKSWRSPSSKLDISKLGRLCGNLVNYDETNKTVSLAHYTVELFLLDCFDRLEVASFAIEGNRAEQYLADTCLTYLSFMDFHQALTQTSDTTNICVMDRPLDLIGSTTPSLIRPWVSHAIRSRRSRSVQKNVDLVNILRTELSAHQSKRIDPTFQILEYCKLYWHSHSSYMDLQDTTRFTALENFVHQTHLPKEWMPWSAISDQESLPYWNMFLWAVRNSHTVIFYVWQNAATTQESSSYWKHLWLGEGRGLFASACATANLEQLEIMLDAKERDGRVVRPSVDDISGEFVSACHLGHLTVVERLLREKANVNAAAANGGGRTALQAAAEGGHLAVVERLLQEKADVNAAADKYSGRTALQAAAEGGHLTVVERLLQEKADVNAAAGEYSGRTALQAAAEGGHLAVVERLLRAKADITASTGEYDGKTALQRATEEGHLAVVERLCQAGAKRPK